MSSYAFDTGEGRVRRTWRQSKKWMQRTILRRRSPLNAAHVVPQGYVSLENMASHTFAECKRADEHNKRLYRIRLDAARSTGPGIACQNVEKPPTPDNCARHMTWTQLNTPVSADQQARAVEALLASDPPQRVLTDYQPQYAMQFQSERNIQFVSSDSPALAASMAQGGISYTVYTDDQLRTMTKKQCIAADKANNLLLSRAAKQSRRERRRLGSVVHTYMDNMAQSRQSNYQRYLKVKQRDVMVSALQQAKAVEYLYDKEMRLYADYEPENAIPLWKQLVAEEKVMIDAGEKETHTQSLYPSLAGIKPASHTR